MVVNDAEVAFLEKQFLTIQKLAKNSTPNLKMIEELARVGHEELQRFKEDRGRPSDQTQLSDTPLGGGDVKKPKT